MKVRNLLGEIHTVSKEKSNATINCKVKKDGKIVLSFNVPSNVGWTNQMIGRYAEFLLRG